MEHSLAASPFHPMISSKEHHHHVSEHDLSCMTNIKAPPLNMSATIHQQKPQLFNEFNEKSITPNNNSAMFSSPQSSSVACSTTSPTSTATSKKKKPMKKKQSDQIFMNQSVIFNHEGKKQRNKTIYTVDHPKVSHLVTNFHFQVGQEVNVKVCECKSEKKTDYFNKIIIDHLGYTNQHNMDPSKTTAIEFVNVLAFKRRKSDSKILWIYESVVLEQLNASHSSVIGSPLKRKLDNMSESDQSSTDSHPTPLEDEFEKCFLETAANPFFASSLITDTFEEQTKRSKFDSKIENIFLECIEPEDAPAKRPTLFQLSLSMNIEHPYHLFNPMMKHFCMDFVTLTEEQVSFDASIFSVQPVFTDFNSIKGKNFQLIGKTPIIPMYDSVNTFARLCVDTEIFICKNVNEERLFFYFYGEDKRMKSEQIIQNPNNYTTGSNLEAPSGSSNTNSNTNVNEKDNNYSDLILFELGSEDNFLFEQFKNVKLESKRTRNLLFDRYADFCRELDGNNEEAIKPLVHIQDALGFTLLMHFAARDMVEEAHTCIQWGANILQKDSFGYDALFWSKHFKAASVGELLRQRISQLDESRGDKFDEIAFQQQLRSGLVDASSRLEKRISKTFRDESTTKDFSSDEEVENTIPIK